MHTRIPYLSFGLMLVLLSAAAAHAQGTYSLTGKMAAGQGHTVQFPAVGVPCDEITGNAAVGINQMQTYQLPTTAFDNGIALNPGGCIPGGAATVTTTGSGGFMLPVGFFSVPYMFNVVAVPFNLAVPQFATSFGFTGPPASPYVSQAHRKAGTPKFTPGPWNSFRANAHLTPMGSTYGSFSKTVAGRASGSGTPGVGSTSMQTRVYLNKYVSGRTSANFTACAQNPAMGASVPCTFPTQGTLPGVVKNIAGERTFGGTMGLVISAGTSNVSSVAVTVAGGYSSPMGMNTMPTRGSLVFNAFAGMTSLQPGRGYAAYATNVLQAATIHTTHMLTTYNMSLPYYSRVIGNVGLGGIMLPAGTNRHHDFPWTTGTQIIRGTGKTLNGGPGSGTFSLMGFDSRMTPMGATGMGGTGSIQLVAGSISQALPLQPFGGGAVYSAMRLQFAPEPDASVALLAGAAGLLGLAAWRRRVR